MTTINEKSLFVKSAALQGIYWMTFGTMYSFAAVYLLSIGFENRIIGLLLAVANIISVLLQPTIGAWVDKNKSVSLKWVIAGITLMMVGLLAALLFVQNNALFTAILISAAICLALTLQPLVNSIIFAYINVGISINFGITRGIGSITFAGLAFFIGLAINQYSPAFLPYVSLGLFTVMFGLMFTFPKIEGNTAEKKSELAAVRPSIENGSSNFLWKYERFPIFLLSLIFLFIFHTLINTYLTQITQSLGGQSGDFGLSLTIAAVCELPAMLGFGFLSKKFTNEFLLKIAAGFYALRSFLYLAASSVAMINFAQLFQGLSFAILIPAAVYYVNQRMDEGDKVKGQTFMVGSTTLGSVFGSLLGGWLLDMTDVHTMLIVGVGAAIIGCVCMLSSARVKPA